MPFNRRPDNRKPRKNFKPRGENRERKDAENPFDKKKGSKTSKYKASRSFSKNKAVRETKPFEERKKFGDGDGDRVPFKRNFKRKNSFNESRSSGLDDKPFERRKNFDKEENGNAATTSKFKPPFKKREGDFKSGSRSSSSPTNRRKNFGESRSSGSNEKFFERQKSYGSEERRENTLAGDFKRPFKKREGNFNRSGRDNSSSDNKRVNFSDFESGKAFNSHREEGSFKPRRSEKRAGKHDYKKEDEGLIRLNKYLSNAGIASRRDADNLIQSGVVKVNGEIITQLGYKIKPTDEVTYSGQTVKREQKVYLILNKPKDYITTVDDPQERKTVMELIKGACRERLYPVGRLDRNTTGLLLFTNDGELAAKLTHPKFGIKKVYHVALSRSLKPETFSSIVEGVELEDGFVKADDLAFVGEGKKELGIEIHSGRNRIVRRLFEHLGYEVIKLDRVSFAGLTKKDLPRGKWRFLTQKEVNFLKMLG